MTAAYIVSSSSLVPAARFRALGRLEAEVLLCPGSPSGRLRPSWKLRIHPTGSPAKPVSAHTVAAATATAGSSHHHES